jgi:hypothetical protein
MLALSLVSHTALAQQGPRPFRLQEMNFDMWCQETQHLAPERCDKRLPEDDAAFQTYSNTIENYEIQYLERHAQDRRIDRMLHDNPADHPPGEATPPPAAGH